MIELKSVHLSNFCQYEDFKMSFQKGMLAVLGPNGVGKSNCFRGIIYALTGWCDQQWGTQTQMQKDDATLPGYAEITFIVDDKEFTVKRFTATGAKYNDLLESKGELVVSKRQRVNEQLEACFGMPLNLLAQLLWVRQEAASWLLTSPPAVINAFLGQLFDMKKVEKVRDALKDAADSIAHLRSDFAVREKAAADELQQMRPIEELEANLEKSKLILSKLKDKKAKLASTEDLPTQEELDIEITAAEAKLASLVQPVRPTEEAKPDGYDPELNYDTAISKERDLETKYMLKRNDLENAIAKHNMSIEDFTEELKKVENISVSDTCELCGKHIDDVEAYLASKTKMLIGNDAEDVELHKIMLKEKIKQITQSRDSMISQLDAVKQEISGCRDKLDNLEMCFSYAVYLKHLAIYEQAMEIYNKEVAEVEKELTQLRAAEVMPADIATTKAKVDKALEIVEDEVKQLELAIANSKARKQILENTISQCKHEAEDYKKNESLRDLFVRARGVLSQQRAQTRYIAGKLLQVNASIADILQRLELPFSLELDLSEHFFKYRNNGCDTWKAASTLSGAQKAMSSVALQLALIEMLHPAVKLLLLDECDAALSEDNKSKLASIINPELAENILIISQSENIINECNGALTLT